MDDKETTNIPQKSVEDRPDSFSHNTPAIIFFLHYIYHTRYRPCIHVLRTPSNIYFEVRFSLLLARAPLLVQRNTDESCWPRFLGHKRHDKEREKRTPGAWYILFVILTSETNTPRQILEDIGIFVYFSFPLQPVLKGFTTRRVSQSARYFVPVLHTP